MMYRPKEYAQVFYGGMITCATVRNWIIKNKLPKGHKPIQTPTGQYLIKVENHHKDEVDELISLIESK